MNYVQHELLKKNSNRLENSLQRGIRMPLLCYALDAEFFSDGEYEIVKDVDYLTEMEDFDNAPNYFLGALLLFIRNFYEHSDNRKVWLCGVAQSEQNSRAKFIQFIRDFTRETEGRVNPLLPFGSDEIREWVRSQCWILKAENGGTTADILENNTILYESLFQTFGPECPQNINDWKLPERLSNCEYVASLFQNHKWELMQSLYAIAADQEEMPANLPCWLKPLWGIKRNTIKEKQQEKLQNVEQSKQKEVNLMMVYNRSYYPALELLEWGGDKMVKQGDRVFTPRTNLVPLNDLKIRGFNITESFTVSDAETEKEISLSHFFEKKFNVFRPRKRHSIWRGLKKYSLVEQNKDSFSRSLLVVHNSNQTPRMQYDDKECQCVKSEGVMDYSLWCSEFELMPLPEDTSIVSVQDEPMFEMINPIGFNLEVSGIVVETENNEKYSVVVGKSTMAFSRVPLTPNECAEVDFIENESVWGIDVHDDAYFKPIKVIFRNAEKNIEKKLFFVPENFFTANRDNFDFSDGNEGKWKLEYEQFVFIGKIETAEWCWNGDTRQLLIEGPEASRRTLCQYGSDSNLELEMNGCVVWAYCSGKTPIELLNYFGPNLLPGEFCRLRISGKEAYRGAYLPEKTCLIEKNGGVYVYAPNQQCSLQVYHELYYKNIVEGGKPQAWTRKYSEKDLKWDNYNRAEICPGYLKFEKDGHVIISLNDKHFFEKTYRGNRSLRERWGSVDVCSVLQHFDIMRPEFQFYRDIKEAVLLIGNATSFEEVLGNELIQKAIHQNISKPRNNNAAEPLLMKNGFFRPQYCQHCQCKYYREYGQRCEKRDDMGNCTEIITTYQHERHARKVCDVAGFCAEWVSEFAPPPPERTQLNSLWRSIKRRLIPDHSWLSQLGDQLIIPARQDVALAYLCAAVILCSPNERINSLPAALRNPQFILDCVSRHYDILRKFILLVRCAHTITLS